MLRVTPSVRRFTRIFPTLALMLTLALLAGLAPAPDTFAQQDGDGDGDAYQPVPVGEAAPGFTLEDLDGESHSLSDLAGEPAVLVFFRGAW